MPINPPVVWHLDTKKIKDKSESPPDRLTRIKIVMDVYVEGKQAPLEDTLLAINGICNDTFTIDDLNSFIERYSPKDK